jgi:hypothetical protein
MAKGTIQQKKKKKKKPLTYVQVPSPSAAFPPFPLPFDVFSSAAPAACFPLPFAPESFDFASFPISRQT